MYNNLNIYNISWYVITAILSYKIIKYKIIKLIILTVNIQNIVNYNENISFVWFQRLCSPGAVKTNFASNSGVNKSESDKWYENYGKLYPVGRVGEGDDIANAVLYLASNESSFITGSVLVADGGHLAANVGSEPYKDLK